MCLQLDGKRRAPRQDTRVPLSRPTAPVGTRRPVHSSRTSPSGCAGRSTERQSTVTGRGTSPRLNAAMYTTPPGPWAVQSTNGSSRSTSRLPHEVVRISRTSLRVNSAIVRGSDVGRSPPSMSGDRAMTQSVKTVTRSAGVNPSSRGVPRSARMPIRPRGSMSASGHPRSPANGAQRASLAKLASTSSQRSHKSSHTRHIVACERRCSACARERSRPGERLSCIGRPQRAIARAYASMSADWYGQSMSSALMKSTPHCA